MMFFMQKVLSAGVSQWVLAIYLIVNKRVKESP